MTVDDIVARVLGIVWSPALVGLCLLRLRRHAPGTAIPFGPYLAIAGWIAVLWGDEIYASYMQLLGY